MTQFFALLISWLIELPIVLIALGIIRQKSFLEDTYNTWILAAAATLFTHPLAWESNQILIPYLEFPLRVALIESCVVLIEGIFYTLILKLGWQKGLFLSLIANTASFCGGLLMKGLLR